MWDKELALMILFALVTFAMAFMGVFMFMVYFEIGVI